MDTVVYLALLVLAAVFFVSLVVLVMMCRRRRVQLKHITASPHLRFSKLQNENLDSLMQLTPLLANALDKNGWVYDVGGILQHCVAVLKLSHSLSEHLATVSLTHTSPQLQDMVCEATHRIMPRFDDLLAAVASPKVDVRILEARATALATVCWSLLMPFTLVNPKCKEVLGEPLTNMDAHLEALRIAADLAERADVSKVDIDWTQFDENGGPGGPPNGGGDPSTPTTPHTIIGNNSTTSTTAMPSPMVTHGTAAPPSDSETKPLVDKAILSKQVVQQEQVANGVHGHPVDPSG